MTSTPTIETTPAVVIPQAYPLWVTYRFNDDDGDRGYYGRVVAWSPAPDGYGWDPVCVEQGHDKVEAVPVREGGPIDWLQLHDNQSIGQRWAAGVGNPGVG